MPLKKGTAAEPMDKFLIALAPAKRRRFGDHADLG